MHENLHWNCMGIALELDWKWNGILDWMSMDWVSQMERPLIKKNINDPIGSSGNSIDKREKVGVTKMILEEAVFA